MNADTFDVEYALGKTGLADFSSDGSQLYIMSILPTSDYEITVFDDQFEKASTYYAACSLELDSQAEFKALSDDSFVLPAPTGACHALSPQPLSGTVVCDYNGDQHGDLAVGIPGEDSPTKFDSGALEMFYGEGTSDGLAIGTAELWTQDSSGFQGVLEPGDKFGSATGCADFNADGFTDLLISAEGEDVGAVADAGALHVLRGSGSGITGAGDRYLTQDSVGVLGVAEAGDRFGASIAPGDFDGDGHVDLAVGAPGEDLGTFADAGGVHVFRGTATGITVSGDSIITQNTADVADTAEMGDEFGTELVTGDFDGDGFADLAIGISNEDVGTVLDTGAVHLFYGSAAGLDPLTDVVVTGTDVGTSETGDLMGSELVAADFNDDGFTDLAVGVPGKMVLGLDNAGSVVVLFGSASGLVTSGSLTLSQATPGISGAPEAGDGFGGGLAAADFDDDGANNLAIGVPGEDYTVFSTYTDGGLVHILSGDPSSWETAPEEATAKLTDFGMGSFGAMFGLTMVAGEFNGDGFAELATGAPNGSSGQGLLVMIPGSAEGPAFANAQSWDQDSVLVPGKGENDDFFGQLSNSSKVDL